MESVSSKAWQSAWLRRHGQHYTAPDEIYDKYKGTIEALDVIGRAQVAARLEALVTRNLCAKYAGLLDVIQELSRHPGRTQPETPDLDPSKPPIDVWKQILEQDPMVGDHWQDPVYETSEEEEEEEDGRPLASEQSETADSSVESDPECALIKPSRVVQKDPPVFSNVVTERDVIREMIYKLLGFSTRPFDDLESCTLSSLALKSVFKEVDDMASVLTFLRGLTADPHLGPSLAVLLEKCMSKLLSIETTTILGTCVEIENALCSIRPLKYLPTSYPEALVFLYENDTDLLQDAMDPLVVAIEQWLSGELSFIVRANDVRANEVWEHGFELVNIPGFCQTPELGDGGKSAFFAKELGLRVPKIKLDRSHPLHWQIVEASLRNSKLLMDHAKPRLLELWNILSCVFLAQAPQMLDIIYESKSKLLFHALPTIATRNDLQSILFQKWPDSPMAFDQNLNPTISIPDVFSGIFNVPKLLAFWKRIVDAIYYGAHDAISVELEALETTRHVKQALEAATGFNRVY